MRLEDILEALDRIAGYLEGMKFEAFEDDQRTQDLPPLKAPLMRMLSELGPA